MIKKILIALGLLLGGLGLLALAFFCLAKYTLDISEKSANEAMEYRQDCQLEERFFEHIPFEDVEVFEEIKMNQITEKNIREYLQICNDYEDIQDIEIKVHDLTKDETTPFDRDVYIDINGISYSDRQTSGDEFYDKIEELAAIYIPVIMNILANDEEFSENNTRVSFIIWTDYDECHSATFYSILGENDNEYFIDTKSKAQMIYIDNMFY